jgi:hypothetical protein
LQAEQDEKLDRAAVGTAQPVAHAVRRGRPERPAPSLRWALTHMIEETGRHAGHADILRELVDGTTGR